MAMRVLSLLAVLVLLLTVSACAPVL